MDAATPRRAAAAQEAISGQVSPGKAANADGYTALFVATAAKPLGYGLSPKDAVAATAWLKLKVAMEAVSVLVASF